MYIHEIAIAVKTNHDREEIAYTMEILTGTLRTAGMIQGREPVEYLQNDRMVAVVYAMEEESLHARYQNDYVKRWIAKLEELCHSTLETKLLGKSSPDYLGTCQCASHSHFVLFTHYMALVSPLICGACDLCVPLYKIPMDDGSHDKILRWQSNYQACDTLQINCEVGERWGLRQMQDPKSALSELGRKVCVRIEELTGTPTYYFLFNWRNISNARDRKRPCPNCGEHWYLDTPLHEKHAFMCEPCRLISIETCNSRG